jgi:uncharacterized membrane protein
VSQFEFVFVLYSLVLGLSLVELLNGLGRTLEFMLAREAGDRAFSIGALTPLLALFVILDLLSFWIFAWTVQEHVAADRFTLLGVLVFASAYFLASRLVFPSDPENFTDLDTHYFRVRRVVFAMLLVMVAAQWAFLLSIPEIANRLITPASIIATGALAALMLGAMVLKGQRASLGVLALLIARYLVIYAL